MSFQESNLPSVTHHNAGVVAYRTSTDAAGLCREIVLATAITIQGRKYVKVEGWCALAAAHGCLASARDVEKVEGGWRAIGEVRRMSDGALLSQAEGFLGDDETMWAKRPVFARRAMVQTRAISRACRTAFAYAIVMIDKNLSTTPAEEMQGVYPHDGDPAPRDVDGPGSSWGSGGKAAAVEDAERDGLTANAPAIKPEVLKRAKDRADRDIATIRLSGQSVESLDAFWRENQRSYEAMQRHVPDEYKRLEKAYNDARDAAEARAA